MKVDEEQRLCQSARVPHAAQPTIRRGGRGTRTHSAVANQPDLQNHGHLILTQTFGKKIH